MAKEYNSIYLGMVIDNNDPEFRGRVQVFIPHIMPTLYEGWNKEGKDITINCVGDNMPQGLTSEIVDKLKKILPWAEAASPIVGQSAPGGVLPALAGAITAVGEAVAGAISTTGEAAAGAINSAGGVGTETAPTASSQSSSEAQQGDATKLQKGGNPNIYKLWNYLKPKFPSIVSDGIWGDKAHQARKSDHNSGNAIDIGHGRNIPMADSIVADIIPNASGYNVKYIIHNSNIWSPSKGWKPYTGANPHDKHIHVSFNV